jgi:hypothetical protein
MRPLLAALALGGLVAPAGAWIYPEHRDIAVLAVQRLDPERRAAFDRMWQAARSGDEKQLCATGADGEQGTTPSCIDWAALSAIAGDHSCSSREMFETARGAPWILQVADVAAQLKLDLAQIPITAGPEGTESSKDLVTETQRRIASEATRARRTNALRTADTRLQRADPQYATRAGSNNAHFLLARPDPGTEASDYAMLALSPDAEISAIGVYTYFHLSALQKASRLAQEPQLAPADKAALARGMMADEAFALHFLEDVYAAGHIAGTWGDASQRKGTHDYYNQNGLEVFTWAGGSRSHVLMGDAHMRPEDADVASASVRRSLEQVIDVAANRPGGPAFADTPAAPAAPDDFDVCRNNTLPRRAEGLRALPEQQRPIFREVLASTPVPSLGPGLGAMPRFRSEVGPFVGLSGAVDGRVVDGGFAPGQTSSGFVGGLDLSVRAGLGLDGVMGDAGDGLVFASIGLRTDGPSTNRFKDTFAGSFAGTGNFSAAIPARQAATLRFRMPFYLIPGDLLLMSPMFFFNKTAYTNMAVTAGNGGLIPWQQGWATGIGRFQFVLGRELGITYYGILSGHDQLVAPAADGRGPRVVNFKSVSYDLPIAEYRPYRAFSTNQSSSVMVQLFANADVPHHVATVTPAGAPNPELRTIWSLGLRLVFDWRYYY